MGAGIPVRRSGRRLMALASPFMMMLATACAGEASGPAQAGARADGNGAMPKIYVDSRIEFISSNRNLAREGYQRNLDACLSSGFPLRELSDDEAARLGTGRLQRWYAPGSFAYRMEEWRYSTQGSGRDGGCLFVLTTRGTHAYFTPAATRTMDLATGAITDGAPRDAEFFARKPGDASADEAARGGARVPDRDREVAGQPCEHLSVDRIDACVWSGGRKWGFGVAMPTVAFDNVPGLNRSITLEQSFEGPSGVRVSTPVFEIGASFDDDDMLPGEAE